MSGWFIWVFFLTLRSSQRPHQYFSFDFRDCWLVIFIEVHFGVNFDIWQVNRYVFVSLIGWGTRGTRFFMRCFSFKFRGWIRSCKWWIRFNLKENVFVVIFKWCLGEKTVNFYFWDVGWSILNLRDFSWLSCSWGRVRNEGWRFISK